MRFAGSGFFAEIRKYIISLPRKYRIKIYTKEKILLNNHAADFYVGDFPIKGPKRDQTFKKKVFHRNSPMGEKFSDL